jgi:polyferredoxin
MKRAPRPSRVRLRLRITNVRIVSQIFFICRISILDLGYVDVAFRGYPVSRILEMDPLVMIATMLSTGHVYRYLGWGILVLGITLLFGRVLCNWVCPYGTLHQFVGWLFNIDENKKRIEKNRYKRVFKLKYMGLAIFLIMAAMGALQIGLMDPICLMYRTFATVVAPASDMVVDMVSLKANGLKLDTLWMDNLKFAPGVTRRVFVGSFWMGCSLQYS